MNEESLTIRLVLISTVLVITLLLGASISSIKKRTAVRPILSPGWSTVVNEGLKTVIRV